MSSRQKPQEIPAVAPSPAPKRSDTATAPAPAVEKTRGAPPAPVVDPRRRKPPVVREQVAVLDVEIGAGTPVLVQASIPIVASETLPLLELNGVRADVVGLTRDPAGRFEIVRASVVLPRPNLGPGDHWRVTVDELDREDLAAQHVRPFVANLDEPVCSFLVVDEDLQTHSSEASELEYEQGDGGTFLRTFARVSRLGVAPPNVRGAERVAVPGPFVSRTWTTVRADGLAVVEAFLGDCFQDYEQVAGCGDIRMLECMFQVPDGWRIVLPFPELGQEVILDPFSGRHALKLLTELGPGEVHEMLRQQGFLLRVVLVHETEAPLRTGLSGDALDAHAKDVGRFLGEAFPIGGKFSWFERHADGPNGFRLAPWTSAFDLWGGNHGPAAVEEQLKKEAWAIDAVRLSGNPVNSTGNTWTSIFFPPMGLFAPEGREQEGEPGDWHLRACDGHRLGRWLLVRRWLELEGACDREFQFNLGAEGHPTTAAGWLRASGGRLDFDTRSHGRMTFPWLRYARGTDGQFVLGPNVKRSSFQKSCPYDELLRRFESHDDQHRDRIAGPARVLAQLSGSPAARFVLEHVASWAGLHWHPFATSSLGQSLTGILSDVRAHKHTGHGAIGRGFWRSMFALAAFYRFAPDSWREDHDAFAIANADLWKDGHMPPGWLQNIENDRIVDDAIGSGAPAGYHYLQGFEEALGVLARDAIARSMLVGRMEPERVDALVQLEASIITVADSYLWPPVCHGAPAWFIATQKNGGAVLDVPKEGLMSPKGDPDHLWYVFAIAGRRLAEARPDTGARNRYFTRSLAVVGQASSYRNLIMTQQALEKEPWHGTADAAAPLWGELFPLMDQPLS